MTFRLMAPFCGLLILAGCVEATNNANPSPRVNLPWGGGSGQNASPISSPYGGFSITGSDQYFNASALGPNAPERAIVVPEGGDSVQLNLVNASIGSAAAAVLGETLGRSFVVAEDVTGSITLQTTGRVSKAALLDLFEEALALNNARMESRSGTIRIVQANGSSRVFRAAGADANSAIIVAPLRYVSPESMLNILQPAIDEGLWVKPENAYNLIMFAGSPAAVNTAMEALNIFDVNIMDGKSIALIPIRAAEPASLAEELKTIFETNEGGRLSGSIEFLPNPASRSILVIANRAALLNEAKTWIRRLDTAARQSGAYVEVYQLNYRDAGEVAPILTSLMVNSPQASGGEENSNASAMPELRISADATRNGIIVRGRAADHDEVRKLLAQLDTNARQVMIEATIAEVTLNDNLNLGVRWFFQNGPFSAGLSDLSSGGVSATSPGFSAVFAGLNAQVALNALSSVTDVQVLSSPTIMVVENRPATLRIGDQVPIATQSLANPSDTTVTTTIEYRDTGVILNVTPRIGANGTVTLKIEQEVSSVVATTTSGIDSPTIRQRQIETTVTVANGATLTLGGLVQENSSRAQSGVPGLQRAPLFGGLFRNRNNQFRRTELLILIRPLVVNTPSEAARITNSWRQQLSAANSVYNLGTTPPTHFILGGQ
ncbi:MAG: type II secretion system secretin GspD [Rhodobacteraceae bacterium]|nr:type II secretion system secretin GspD [Paracoccaceae bacterium]